MMYTLFAIIFLGGVIGWGVVRLSMALLSQQLKQGVLKPLLQRELLNTHTLSALLDSVDWETEISPLIDLQLEKLIETFKQRNPMIALFLTQEIAKPMQITAKEELLHMIPKLKKTLIDRLTQERAVAYLEGEISKRVQRSIQYDPLWRKMQWCAALLGVAFGSLGGLCLLLVQHFISYP